MGPCARCSPPRGPTCPPGGEWLHEVKWDGMRVLVDVRADGELHVRSRNENDVTVSFPELHGLAGLGRDVLLDGEVVAFLDGIPTFGALADRMHVGNARRAARARGDQPGHPAGLRPAPPRRRGPHRPAAERAPRAARGARAARRALAGARGVRRRRDAAARRPSSRGSRASSVEAARPRATVPAGARRTG